MSVNKNSKWSRMVRRTSSLITVSRPNTPSIASDRDADSASLSRISVNTPALALPQSQAVVPSPIAESPAREALESLPATGPSPLAQEAATGSENKRDSTSSDYGYVPPPVLDSSTAGLGPGAFTDEPDDIPQPTVIKDPSIHQAPSIRQAPSVDEHGSIAHTNEEQVPTAPATDDAGSVIKDVSIHAPTSIAGSSVAHLPEESAASGALLTSGAAADYFNHPGSQADEEVPQIEEAKEISNETQGYYVANVEEEPSKKKPVEKPVEKPMEREVPALFQGSNPGEYSAPIPPIPDIPKMDSPTSINIPSYDYHVGQEVWGGIPHPDLDVSRGNGDIGQSSRLGMPLDRDDPFADPIAPRITVSNVDAIPMPQPHVVEHYEEPREFHEEAHGGIVMPLPAHHEVIPERTTERPPSTLSLGSSHAVETDERRPLLSQSPKNTYLQSSVGGNVAVSPQSGVAWPSQGITTVPRLHNLGWIEYSLPDSTVYYVHPTLRVTTDIDLRSGKRLDAVTAYFENHKESAPPGLEMWLRDSGTTKRGFVPIIYWINHQKRMISRDAIHELSVPRRSSRVVSDDQLDMEYRYWSFLESHPAHAGLPGNARAEAMDVLTWAWTDRLLPSHRAVPAPFSQDECQELMTLLRSFGDTQDSGTQTVVHTRIVARILLRVAHWRQANFRPNKPLPKDATRGGLVPERRRPFRRALFDFVLSCMCLGIPYMFFDRTQYHRFDEESGMRAAAPMLVIGACTCLVAAIVLSASVTFLSLPGLDGLARVAGLVAILFASFSMASTIVAVFRYKADMERSISHVGGEGLMHLSRRSIVMSLPLVFLVYAIIGFTAAVVLYSLRGSTLVDSKLVEHRFDDYTRWTVVGLLGGLAGIFATSLLLLRREREISI